MAFFQKTSSPGMALVLACAGFFGASALSQEAPAQDEPVIDEPAGAELRALQQKAAALLASSERRDQAWGAWYTAHHHLEELCPTVNALLKRLVAQDIPETDRYLIPALADALIQNNGQPSLEVLSALWDKRYTDEVLAMVAPHVKQCAPFLVSAMDRKTDDVHHAAVCNLLIKDQGRLFVDTVLPRIQLTLDIEVVDPDPERVFHGGGGRRSLVKCGDGTVRRRAGLPPPVIYTLSFYPHAQSKVLVDGPRLVYVERRVYWKDGGCGSISTYASDVRLYWRDCLMRLADPSGTPDADELSELRFNRDKTLEWTDLASLDRDIASARAQTRAPWLELCRRLQKREPMADDEKLLPNADLNTLFPVQVKLRDSRTKKEVPLPNMEDSVQDDEKAF